MLFSGEIYTTGKNHTLPPAVTHLTSEVHRYFWFSTFFFSVWEKFDGENLFSFGVNFSSLMGNSPFWTDIDGSWWKLSGIERKLAKNWQKLTCFPRHHLSVLRRCNFSAGRWCLWQCLFLSSTISFSVLRRDQNHQNWLLNVSILSSQRRWKLIGVVSFGPTFCGTRNVPAVTFINLSKTKYKQGSRSWQPFIEGKKGHEKLRKARIYYFCDKCIVFARNCKFAHLTQYNMQYIPCIVHFLHKNRCFWPKKAPFLPEDFQKVGKSRQILISRQNNVC